MHTIRLLARRRHGNNVHHVQIRGIRFKHGRIPQEAWKDIVGKGNVSEKGDDLSKTVQDQPSYDDYFWEHILNPSDREFLANHGIHCVKVLHEAYSSWLAPKRGRSPSDIQRANAAFKIYQTVPDKIIENGVNKACEILTGLEDYSHQSILKKRRQKASEHNSGAN